MLALLPLNCQYSSPIFITHFPVSNDKNYFHIFWKMNISDNVSFAQFNTWHNIFMPFNSGHLAFFFKQKNSFAKQKGETNVPSRIKKYTYIYKNFYGVSMADLIWQKHQTVIARLHPLFSKCGIVICKWHLCRLLVVHVVSQNSAVQNQKAASAHFTSKQILPFGFADQRYGGINNQSVPSPPHKKQRSEINLVWQTSYLSCVW